jgi:para-nitrobenzyl esterase
MIMTRREFASNSALIAAAATPIASAFAKEMREPIVETNYGKIRGVAKDGVYAFKAIPYAASTAGANRFMPPQKLREWTGVRDCFAWGPMAPQAGEMPAANATARDRPSDFRLYFGVNPDMPSERSEDCLSLNVFTQGLGDGGKRPVLVWIHGGGFNSGSGAGARTNGTNLALRQDVVSVSLNHRLGVLGYCHLGDFDPAFAESGNVGQLDLIAALEWVRDNIEKFGGDPTRVMVHGESGGGAKIGTLLAMPRANGLFHRAVMQSGTANKLPTRDQASEWVAGLLKELQIPKNQVKQLQQVPVDRLLAAADAIAKGQPQGPGRGFVPTVGTAELPIMPLDAVAAGSARSIPLIIGCTQHESALFLLTSGTDPRSITEEQLKMRITAMHREHAPEVLAGYRKIHRDYSPGDLLIRIMSDGARMSAINLAEAHIKGGGAPTYMYLFTWESPVLPQVKAGHSIDCTFYFDNTDSVEIAKGNAEARALAKGTSTAWANFARNAKPSAPTLPAWPQYTLDKRETMIFATQSSIQSDPLKDERLLQARLS